MRDSSRVRTAVFVTLLTFVVCYLGVRNELADSDRSNGRTASGHAAADYDQ